MSKYHSDLSMRYSEKTGEILKQIPSFFRDYFSSISVRSEASTRYNYAVDLKTFLTFMVRTMPELSDKGISDITEENFASVKAKQIEDYMNYLQYYENKINTECGLLRKISTIRTIYRYFLNHNHPVILVNPVDAVQLPRKHEKDLIYLDEVEIEWLLNCVKNPVHLTPKSAECFEWTKYRDYAIITLFLGTGIRLSECAGLNLGDLDFRTNSCLVQRKGRKYQTVYFNDSVKTALEDYINLERGTLTSHPDDLQGPLFFSMKRNRMSARSIEYMVTKYARMAIPNKKISVHKLRASYATYLYKKTHDIYLVSDALGHNSINTTKIYTNVGNEHRKDAKDFVDYL